jgi:hypothetical protein
MWDVLASCEITGAANAQWNKEKLIEEYKAILKLIHE